MRDLYVKIDDGEEQNLKFPSEVEMTLTIGTHTIYATNRMYTRRQEFEIVAGGDSGITFEVANTTQGCAGALFAMGFGPYQCELRRIDA
jgi:hypothetical protein